VRRYQFKDKSKSCFFEIVIQSGNLGDLPRQKLGGLKPTFEFGPNWKRWQTLLEMAHLMRGQGKSGSGALVWDVLVYVPKKLGASALVDLEKALQASLEEKLGTAATAAAASAAASADAGAVASASESGGTPGVSSPLATKKAGSSGTGVPSTVEGRGPGLGPADY
jgi:hypothetical protein